MSKKAASDTAAYVRTLAEARGRNVALAADAVLTSRAFTDRESLEAMPRLIDLYMAGKLKLDQLVTRTYKLDDLNTALAAMEKGEVARSVIAY